MLLTKVGQNGSVTVIALVILVLLTVMGISVSRITAVDIRIHGNEKRSKELFYTAEGGLNRLAQELGNGGYPVPNPMVEKTLADNTNGIGEPFPEPPHVVNGEKYNFTVKYTGYDDPIPRKGYGVLSGHVAFNFEINSRAAPMIGGKLSESPRSITSRYHKIGPRPQ